MFTVKVPATSANLGPGFDTAGIAFCLYNKIEVYLGDEKEYSGDFFIESENKVDKRIDAGQIIPINSENLIYKTIIDFAVKEKLVLPRFYMKQIDEIPLTRGLGSSAACIVAGLCIANKLLNTGYTVEELMHIAVNIEGHPDNVAPAFMGSMVVGASDNGRFEYVKIDVNEKLEWLALIPDFPLSTEDARAVLPRAYTKEQAVFNCSRVALMVASMMSGNFNALSIAMQDEIHQPYRKILIPGMEAILKKSLETGSYGGYLSGAGPTIMLCNPKGSDVMNKMIEFIKNLKNFWLCKPLDIDKKGVIISEG